MGALVWVYTVVMTLVLAAGLGAVIRRILGARVGWLRTLVVAWIALLVGVPITGRLAVAAGVGTETGRLTTSQGTAVAFLLVSCLWVFAAALGVVMLLEVLVPSGTVPGPREAVGRFRAWLRRTRRYLQIGRAATGSGLSAVLRGGPGSAAFGPALASVFNKSGVTFVKLGQILATRDDLLPAETTRALATLQSDADPEPYDAVATTIGADLGDEPAALFATFDTDPLAAASVAQVHTATLHDGREVVVKVQRSRARRQVEVDTDILVRLARTAEQRWPWARDMGVSRLAAGLAQSLREELDYRIEAGNTAAGAAALRDRPDIVVPAVDAALSSRRVLVMDRLHGVPLSAGEAAVAGLSRERRVELADTLIGALLDTVFVAGVFHADLHPGNILVLDDGRVGLLDFGAVGILDSETRQLLALLLFAILSDDAVSAVDALILAFDVPDDLDVPLLRRELGREIAALQLQTTIGGDTFTRIFAVLRRHGIGVPGDVAAAFRTLTSVEAAITLLDPGSSLLQSARAQLPSLLQRLAAPKRVAAQAVSQAGVVAAIARRLPERVEHLTSALGDGSFTVRTRAFGDADDRAWLRDQVNNGLAAAFGITACILAVVLALNGGGPQLTEELSLFGLLGLALGFCGVTLALRVVVRLFQRRE
ncbi:ABC1 kinase family protein [Pimelobacter simplex]|uniref:ABC1 kinase family protein n=1 Tax=Nocardioides simplex TaxID=2045 RepID=UPI00193397AE|nr:AarF/ABC1/UbiB kinase family protein [Pimelobacter simplex]